MTDRKTEPLPTAYALRLANRWAQGGVCSMRESDVQRYHAACAAALHEKLEREEWSKGCEYCKDESCRNCVHFYNHDFCGGNMHPDWTECVKFEWKNFCSECGRKLKED